jgi:CubicO group peptidase (beta-lactamase class C family)
LDGTRLQELADRLRADADVPGLVVGVSYGGQRVSAATGTANVAAGTPMTTDAGFLFGSVTKVWVTTLLMQLVEEGLVSLDHRVTDVLPDFATADRTASDQLTMRHLVNHTSGIDGGDFCPDDLGRGPESVARYVERLRDLPQLHAPGEYWSYCNPGFVVAGRVIEVLTGRDFDDTFRARLLGPLGLTRTFLTPEESILWPVTVGHFPLPGGGNRVTGRYLLPRSLGPAGSSLATTVDDALTFADLHLGRVDGVVSKAGLAEMAAHQVDLPAPGAGGFGLGWGRATWSDTVVLSHGGGSVGGLAQLTVVPDKDLALAAFVNSAAGAGVLNRLVDEVLGELGLARPVPEPSEPGPVASFVGRFTRYGFDTEITADGDELVVRNVPDPTNAVLVAYGAAAPSEVRCRPTGTRSFGLPPSTDGALPTSMGVLVGDDYLFLGGRLSRRVT